MGGYVLVYDAENRQTKATIGSSVTQYWYDGDGRRVTKHVGTGTPTVYVYDAGGELADVRPHRS
jgi:YD repeat-containing protein